MIIPTHVLFSCHQSMVYSPFFRGLEQEQRRVVLFLDISLCDFLIFLFSASGQWNLNVGPASQITPAGNAGFPGSANRNVNGGNINNNNNQNPNFQPSLRFIQSSADAGPISGGSNFNVASNRAGNNNNNVKLSNNNNNNGVPNGGGREWMWAGLNNNDGDVANFFPASGGSFNGGGRGNVQTAGLMVQNAIGTPYFGSPVGRLNGYQHGVSGEVYAVDDETVLVKRFTFDGQVPGTFHSVCIGSGDFWCSEKSFRP